MYVDRQNLSMAMSSQWRRNVPLMTFRKSGISPIQLNVDAIEWNNVFTI
jgi:hypothetical protein